ncbi:hypothetical protein G3N55_07020 [Dissulfurirhabdus thermomarina]|uniref:Uncharacterized protein n=1 Tax=Dissulfurirhabdus thermomarina TaxID=1765737 RepID=A0A6N9TR63_DISTH|nr:hypothetical protein [Dissulfurirhabdus thermomarina]NDY42593.1 hypothetical protein [Dissulfurirhabdus thermomarina]NMX24483.1 hypothetical protein [Dissulfurirhabdus thermomarina]
MAVWRFAVQSDQVRMGNRRRRALTRDGCNEPFKGRFWCPARRWFRTEPCPFESRDECANFRAMCGRL